MNPFMRGFLDELSKHGSLKDVVQHPATQAVGYAALAGAGIHRLSEMGKLGPRAKRIATKTKFGRGAGVGALGGSAAFLAAEAASALGDVFSKKRKKKAGDGPDVIIKMQAPAPTVPRIRLGRLPKTTSLGLGRLGRAIGFKR